MGNKKWYQSKTILAGIIAVMFGIYDAASTGLAAGCGVPGGLCANLPIVPTWIFSLLAAFGIYGRATATTIIK